MHKHTITFEDFNGNTKTKDLYFNLTEAELTKMQKDYLDVGGLDNVMSAAIASGDTKQLLDFFELLVHNSYGIKSPDGEVFDKSPDIMRRFENSAFYSPFYMSLFQDGGRVGSAFINAIMPADLLNKATANIKGEGELSTPEVPNSPEDRLAQARANLKDHLPKAVIVEEDVKTEFVPVEVEEKGEDPNAEKAMTRSEWLALQETIHAQQTQNGSE